MPTLKDITDKADGLYQAINDDTVTNAMDQRVNTASRQDLKKIEGLMHFGPIDRRGTTDATRQDMRRAVVGYLAAGGSVDGAEKLRSMAKTLGPQELSSLAVSLSKTHNDPTEKEFQLSRAFVGTANNRADANVQGLSTVLSGLPRDPQQIGTVVYGNNPRTAVYRDNNGDLQVKTQRELQAEIKRTCTGSGVRPGTMNQLDGVLNKLDGKASANVMLQMQGNNANIPKALSSALDRKSPTAQQDYNAIKGVFAELPPELNKAGQTIAADNNLTLKLNNQGRVEVVNADLSFTGVQIPNGNRNMSANKIQEAKLAFDDIAKTNYGRAGVPLDFMRHARENPNQTMAQALQTYQPNGSQVAATNKNGDCLCLAEQLVQELNAKGITSYAAGVNTAKHTMQTVGDLKEQSVTNANLMSANITHLDVIVPYTDNNGAERALVFTPGMGSDQKWSKDLPMSEVNGPNHPDQQRLRLNGEGQGVSSESTQRTAMGYRTNIQITNGAPETPGNKHIGGIDLVNGNLYLTSAASNAFQGVGPDSGRTLSFNYRDAVANPDDLVTMKKGDQEFEMTKIEALAVFSEGVREHFDLPDDFVDNVMHLAANEKEYHQAVLWDRVQEMQGLKQNQQFNHQQTVLQKPQVNLKEKEVLKVEEQDEIEIDSLDDDKKPQLDLQKKDEINIGPIDNDKKPEIELSKKEKRLSVGDSIGVKKSEKPKLDANELGTGTQVKDKIKFFEGGAKKEQRKSVNLN